MFRSSNPAFNPRSYEKTRTFGLGETMTIQGTVNKTMISLFLLVVSAAWTWSQLLQPAASAYPGAQAQVSSNIGPIFMGALVGSIAAWLVTAFKKEWSAYSVPVYSVFEGILIGTISSIFERSYPGIVVQSVALTFGVLFCMLLAYRTGFVTVTQKFRMGVTAALGAIFLIYMVNIVMRLFGGGAGFLYSSSPLGIGFSLIVVGVAALTLVLDFDFIEHAARAGVPKYMEWYSVFGLLVSLVWLYLELLRLLSLIANRE
ncbi:MAG: Bax inhibitor-1/YccA family protein [Candidatus Omnitrophica bacterium]|nr:Bax inhibitor-1/YccA family protein [Candidatus Omnitrophota bacterium]